MISADYAAGWNDVLKGVVSNGTISKEYIDGVHQCYVEIEKGNNPRPLWATNPDSIEAKPLWPFPISHTTDEQRK